MSRPGADFGGAALITGASAGIGAAFARALAARKMDLVLVARRREQLEALARELEAAHGVRAHVIAQDLGLPGAAQAVQRELEQLGVEVGLLVNNAGFGTHGPFEAQDRAREAAMVDLNCRLPVELTHLVLPPMLRRGKGGLIFVASTAAYQPTPYFAVYGATKAFDLMLAEALWAELRPRGIAVLGLSPGYTETEFQMVAGTTGGPGSGSPASPAEVVETALRALGRAPSVVDGVGNFVLANAARAVPRAVVAGLAARVNRPRGLGSAAATPGRAPPTASSSLQRDLARLLLTFGAVSAIDLIFVSWFTGTWRVWFPVWLDPDWALRARPWVVYSQSYLAGVFCIPLLARALDRELLAGRSARVRGGFWVAVLGTLAFLGWWKGGLMVQYGKHREAVGWLLLSGLIYALVVLSERLGTRLGQRSGQAVLRRLSQGVAGFFLTMAVVDPLLQVGVQSLGWSTGLLIEVGFFVPAGLGLLWAARGLGQASTPGP
jgi:uncharacterized protein